jgi:hypothetical protein
LDSGQPEPCYAGGKKSKTECHNAFDCQQNVQTVQVRKKTIRKIRRKGDLPMVLCCLFIRTRKAAAWKSFKKATRRPAQLLFVPSNGEQDGDAILYGSNFA